MKTLKIILKILLMIFGIIITIGGLVSIISGNYGKKIFDDFIYLIVFGLSPIGLSIILLIKTQKSKKLSKNDIEKIIINIAKNNNGNITNIDLAEQTSLTIEEAKIILNEYSDNGIIDVKVAKGALLYQLKDYLSEDDKNKAKDII